jgi:hypothetical protein
MRGVRLPVYWTVEELQEFAEMKRRRAGVYELCARFADHSRDEINDAWWALTTRDPEEAAAKANGWIFDRYQRSGGL